MRSATIRRALAFSVLIHAGGVNADAVSTDFKRLQDTGSCAQCNLAGADLSGAYVQGSLFGADLSTATLTRLRVSLEGSPLPAGTGFTGQDLSGWAFSSYTGVADLTGVDFSGANPSGASFGGVDLTGADFTGAVLADVRFSTSTDPAVTCPDGLPVDATQPGPAACRLGA